MSAVSVGAGKSAGSVDNTLQVLQSHLRELSNRQRPFADLNSSDADPFSFLTPSKEAGDLGCLGPFHVLSLLGRGGMGMVFEAFDPALQRSVALKVMLPDSASKPMYRERFLREARAAARVAHDHIVPIYQVGEEKGTPFLAMKLLRGEALEARLRRQPAPTIAEAVRIIREATLGLAAAHACGLIHRDLKPDNLWLEELQPQPRIVLLDFGLARPLEEPSLTSTGQFAGTPGYIPPESTSGTTDARGDLFSLGVILYRLLTGRYPFSTATVLEYLRSVANDRPKPPHTINPAVPMPLSALTLRLLEQESAKRPDSAQQFLSELDALGIDGADPEPTVIIPPTPVLQRLRFWPVAGVFALVLLLGGSSAFMVLHFHLLDSTPSGTEAPSQPKNTTTAPVLLGPGHMLAAVANDLQAAPTDQRPGRRFLTMVHLSGLTTERQDLAQIRLALAQLGTVTAPQGNAKVFVAVDPEQTVFRFDLSALGWDDQTWTDFLSGYPYGLNYAQADQARLRESGQRIQKLVGDELVFVRADWFLHKLARSPEALPKLPKQPRPELLRAVETVARTYDASTVDLAIAAAELGVSDLESVRRVLRDDNKMTQRLHLAPLLNDGAVSRSAWESRESTTTPYQELANRLGQGTPLSLR